jgi:hypothetical protein
MPARWVRTSPAISLQRMPDHSESDPFIYKLLLAAFAGPEKSICIVNWDFSYTQLCIITEPASRLYYHV